MSAGSMDGTRAPKIVLATVGSHGDLNPMIALALGLQQQGLHPVIATSGEYRAKVAAAGIAFEAVRPSAEQVRSDLGLSEQEILQRVASDPAFLLRDLPMPYARGAYEEMRVVLEGADLLLSTILAFGARLAAEKLAVPQMGVALQPSMFLSAHDPAMNPHAVAISKLCRRLGPGVTGAAVWMMKKVVNRWAAPLAELRREIGLPPYPGNLIFDAMFSPLGNLALYSPVLGGVQPDYPPRTQVTGFAFYDEDPEEGAETGADLARFLAAGDAPIAFVLGSAAHVDARDFFQVSVEAARALARRAVVVTGSAPAPELSASADVFACRYARYSQLFAGAAAIVHQGGIGTLAQAMRAGKPEIVVPFLGDQLDNGTRVERLGAARVVAREKYQKERVVAELGRVLNEPSYAAAAASIAAKMRSEDGVGQAVAAIQRVLAESRRATA
jgi:UDP:flavonoid glycosyltransferase YjiC (YdhE family)